MAHKLPSKEYILMLDIKYIVQSWQNLSYSDRDSIHKIESLILEYQKAIWKENH